MNKPGDMVLTITLTPSGVMNMDGPIDNALLCYGLLEAAKLAIAERQKQRAGMIQPTLVSLPITR